MEREKGSVNTDGEVEWSTDKVRTLLLLSLIKFIIILFAIYLRNCNCGIL